MNAPSNWTALALEGPGRSLVEASAGTGKTWTIGVLYLRLLLEQQLSPRRIIVATFTNAAAAELAERLRERLLWALAEAEAHVEDDAALAGAGVPADRAWLRSRWRADNARRAADVQRLQAALGEFDGAPIATLHALCARILADHPVAAGISFRGRGLIDARMLAQSLQDDLWRVITQGQDDDPLVQLARTAEISRSDLKKYVPVLMQAHVCVHAEVADIDLHGRLHGLGFLDDPVAWATGVHAIATMHFRANSRLRKAWIALAEAVVSPSADSLAALGAGVEYLENAHVLTGITKSGIGHPGIQTLIRQTEAILPLLPVLAIDLASSNPPLRRFLDAARAWCRRALRARLDAADQSTFDELLVTVRDALAPRDGHRALADALFAAWPVALVDEFQDTDTTQFDILDAIYRDADGGLRGRLVMIGDPKQAIYRFRGGDVQAYESASASVPDADRLTLDTNFRSSRGYVEAINQFYATTGTRLGPQDSTTMIHYEAVHASNRRDAMPLHAAASRDAIAQPLVLHVLRDVDKQDDLQSRALRACADQIVHALSNEACWIGDEPLKPGDIAVLLPSHAQIAALAKMLKQRKVPCVVVSKKSVFETDTARDLRLILHAVLHPDDAMALRAALVTRLCGRSLRELKQLRDAPAEWDREASRFHALHAVLEQRGPLAVVTQLLEPQAARLLASVEGERILTDLRHLGELSQEAWQACGSGERLQAWFADQVEGDGDEDAVDARALRLESDADRVKLMTLHVSKGLEFPVVFLPLMWKHGPHSNAGARWLVDPGTGDKCIVLGPAKEEVKRQELEERHRILYVAMTRAIHACHLHVLEKADARHADAPINGLVDGLLQDTADPATSRIARCEGWPLEPAAAWSGVDAAAPRREARALPEPASGPLPLRHSFSTLVGSSHRRSDKEEGAAGDEAALEAATDVLVPGTPAAPHGHEALEALAGVAGIDFGNAVHAVFEHRVAGAVIDARQVRDTLAAHGVRPRDGDLCALAAKLAARLQAVLDTPLGSHAGPRLADLSSEDMRAEMAFDYVLDDVSLRAMREACEAHGEPGLVPDGEQQLAGLMNGKIDLVFAHDGRFHVLDYKGNRLGSAEQPCLEAYAPAAIEQAMQASGYRFQALLYTLALEGFLRERLGAGYARDQHLGDCWYLFIRAVGLALPDGTPCGIWRHRFSDGLLDALRRVMGVNAQREAA